MEQNKTSRTTGKIALQSILKMSPHYLAKNSPVMFTVEVGFLVVLAAALFPEISGDFFSMG